MGFDLSVHGVGRQVQIARPPHGPELDPDLREPFGIDQGIEGLPKTHPQSGPLLRFRSQTEADFAGRVLPLSEEMVRLWGRMAGQRRLAGLGTLPVTDALLAVTAIHDQLRLATQNMRDVSGLGASVFNPWADDPADFPLGG